MSDLKLAIGDLVKINMNEYEKHIVYYNVYGVNAETIFVVIALANEPSHALAHWA